MAEEEDLAYLSAVEVQRHGPMLSHIGDHMEQQEGESVADAFARTLRNYFGADMATRLVKCLRPLLEVCITDEEIDGRILMAAFYMYALSVMAPLADPTMELLADLAHAFVRKYDEAIHELVASKRITSALAEELLAVAVTFYREMQCWLSEI